VIRRSFALVGMAVALVGCTSSGSSSQPAPSRSVDPDYGRLVARAHLSPCPASTATPLASDALPNLTLPCLGDGPAVHVAGLRGKPTVVNIWASWCENCQREDPYFAQVAHDLGGSVRFLGVDTDDSSSSALDFLAHVSIHYPSVVDADKQFLLGVGGSLGPPVTVYVGANGEIVHKKYGEYRSAADLRADIAQYLGVHA
jgi:cytochrome c biogenesis protein CcmG/thiol:disulfide interchange protein DsbE